MNPLILQFEKITPLCLKLCALGFFAASLTAQAAPAPNTPDPGSVGGTLNTADGQSAMPFVTGEGNSAFGAFALFSTISNNFNTAVGAGALDLNTADGNTAVGAAALLFNTTGGTNTAVGVDALFSNTTGGSNTAVGASALQTNTTGIFNTANGATALFSNTTGSSNTGVGVGALLNNTTNSFNTGIGTTALAGNSADGNTGVGAAALFTPNTGPGNTAVGVTALFSNTGDNSNPPNGRLNTAVGLEALFSNTTGNANTAVGAGTSHSVASSAPAALGNNITGQLNTAVGGTDGFDPGALGFNTTGSSNTAIGVGALGLNNSGSKNTAVGRRAGLDVTSASNVICIGFDVGGADVDDTCFIGNIRGVTTQNNDAMPVLIDSAGQLGTASSSRRYKTDIKPMDIASESILALKPVSFRYKVHKDKTLQYGLIAEEVAEVNPSLVIYDADGNPYTVRYEAVNAMLLNEFLKEHRRNEEQGATIARLEKQIEALTVGLQRVSAQLQASKPAPQIVLNNR
jgi:hypothetical protein